MLINPTQGIQFRSVATRLSLAILPPALLALTAQRYIVRGRTFGAVKGGEMIQFFELLSALGELGGNPVFPTGQ